MKETEMRQIAVWTDEAIANFTDKEKLASIRGQVIKMVKDFPLYM